MKWFKHISDSLDDPFIFELIRKFGANGYLTFFGLLEMYAREYKPEPGWKLRGSWVQLRSKLQRRCIEHVVRVCREIAKAGRAVFDEGSFGSEYFVLYIPKFHEYADEWTQRKLGSRSRGTPKNLRLEEEEDTEEEEDKESPLKESKEKSPQTFSDGSLAEKLMNEWRGKNPDQSRAYPKHMTLVKAEITAAMKRGWNAQEIEQRIWDTAGQGIPPWDLFKKKPSRWDLVEQKLREEREVNAE